MDASHFSAFAALAGSIIGGLTSLATSWVAQRAQFKAQQRAKDVARRIQLYKDFINEASRLYADAYEHDKADVSALVNLYALVSKMRVLSSPSVIEHADTVASVIIDTYLGPNKTFRDVREILTNNAMDPLRAFSAACREELRLNESSGVSSQH